MPEIRLRTWYYTNRWVDLVKESVRGEITRDKTRSKINPEDLPTGGANSVTKRLRRFEIIDINELEDVHFYPGIEKLCDRINALSLHKSNIAVQADKDLLNLLLFVDQQDQRVDYLSKITEAIVTMELYAIINQVLKFMRNILGIDYKINPQEANEEDELGTKAIVRPDIHLIEIVHDGPSNCSKELDNLIPLIVEAKKFGLETQFSKLFENDTTNNSGIDGIVKQLISYVLTSRQTKCVVTDYLHTIFLEFSLPISRNEDLNTNTNSQIRKIIVSYRIIKNTDPFLTLRLFFCWFLFTNSFYYTTDSESACNMSYKTAKASHEERRKDEKAKFDELRNSLPDDH